MMTSASDDGRRTRRRWRRLAVVGAVVLPPLAVLTAMLLSSPPYWADAVDASDPSVVQRAEQLERDLTSAATSVRGDDEVWELELSQQALNEWLAVRLPRWLRNQGAGDAMVRQIESAMVVISPDRVELAARIEAGPARPILRLTYQPQVNEQGRVTLVLDRVRAGRLPLPKDRIARAVAGEVEGEAAAADPLRRIDLQLDLGDGRVVDVVGIELEKGRARLVCRTRAIGP